MILQNKTSHSSAGAKHTARSPAEKRAILRKGRGGHLPPPTVRQDLPVTGSTSTAHHAARSGKYNVPPWARMICSTTQTQNVGVFSPLHRSAGVQHGGRVAHAVVGYRDPQRFLCAPRKAAPARAGVVAGRIVQVSPRGPAARRPRPESPCRRRVQFPTPPCSWPPAAVTELGGQPLAVAVRPDGWQREGLRAVLQLAGQVQILDQSAQLRSGCGCRTLSGRAAAGRAVSCSSCSAQPRISASGVRTSWLTPRSNLCGHRPAGR